MRVFLIRLTGEFCSLILCEERENDGNSARVMGGGVQICIVELNTSSQDSLASNTAYEKLLPTYLMSKDYNSAPPLSPRSYLVHANL